MSPDTLFTICNVSVLPAWLLLVLAPRWRWTQAIVHSCAIPLALAVVYIALAIPNFFGGEGNFNSLEGVMTLFENPNAVLAGWIHYLAFDLFVGAWEARDAKRLGVPHLLVVPCLVFTFMLGPTGLLLYFALRIGWKRRFIVREDEPAPESGAA